MLRRLSGLERQFYQQNLVGSTNIVCALSFDGRLDSSRLQNALEQLLQKNPVLTYQILADPFIRFAPMPRLTLPYEETQGSDWRTLMEKDLNRQYPGPQIFLRHLIDAEEKSHLLLGLNHAVVDGLSSLNLARDLIDLYAGRDVNERPHGEGVESRFPKDFRGLRGWWRAARFISILAKMGPALQIGSLLPTQNTQSLGFVFSHMSLLNEKARQKESNFFALFSAVVLKTLHEIYISDKTAGLSLNTPVSLRTASAIAKDEIGVFLAGHLSLYTIQSDTDLFVLAKECFENLQRGVAEGRPFLLTRWARGSKKPNPPKVPTRISTHRPTVSISNLGRVEEMPNALGTHVTEVHAVSAQSLKDPFAFVLATYKGKTFIDLQYSREKLTSNEAHAMLEGVRQKLAVLSANS